MIYIWVRTYLYIVPFTLCILLSFAKAWFAIVSLLLYYVSQGTLSLPGSSKRTPDRVILALSKRFGVIWALTFLLFVNGSEWDVRSHDTQPKSHIQMITFHLAVGSDLRSTTVFFRGFHLDIIGRNGIGRERCTGFIAGKSLNTESCANGISSNQMDVHMNGALSSKLYFKNFIMFQATCADSLWHDLGCSST